MSGDKKVRVTIDLKEPLFERLALLTENTSASSKADVIREALQLYEYLLGLQQEGHDFAIRRKDEWERVLLFPHRVSPKSSG